MNAQEIALQPHEDKREMTVFCRPTSIVFTLVIARDATWFGRLWAVRHSGVRGHGRYRKLDQFLIDNVFPNWEVWDAAQ